MSFLAFTFDRFQVPLWATASLRQAVPESHESYVVFCLPYSQAAIDDLPDDSAMNHCKADLDVTTKRIYQAILQANPEAGWTFYDQMDRRYNLRSAGVSQKVLAHLAGLGWIGRSSLLITEQFGAQTRIGTIFTEAQLPGNRSHHTGSCGKCRACLSVCPARAISDSGYDVKACRSVVSNANGDSVSFCGLCMKVCSRFTALAAQEGGCTGRLLRQ